VHCNNICRPADQYPPSAALLVDVESSLWGIDKVSSKCDTDKHPFCGPQGCLLTKDPRIPPHITPYACERGLDGDNSVVTTNMRMPTDSGFVVPNTNVCDYQGNGYYVDHLNGRSGAPRSAPQSAPRSAPRQAPQSAPQSASRSAPRSALQLPPGVAPRSAPQFAPQMIPQRQSSLSMLGFN